MQKNQPGQLFVRCLSVKYYLWTLLLIFVITVTGHLMLPLFDLVDVAFLYLLPILYSAVQLGRIPSLFASILCVATFDYFFVPPTFSFIPSSLRDLFILAVFVLVAFVTGTMATRLRNERERLRVLTSRLQSIREEERTRIAREIHDGLGQVLTGLKMSLVRLSKKLSKHQEILDVDIQSMEKIVDDTIRMVRVIAKELRPGILDDLGLVSAIECQIEDFMNQTKIQCEFSTTLRDSDIDSDLATTLFRILQETLTNIARHSQATNVKINIKTDANLLILIVQDNGRGIKEEETSNPSSLGLLGINERAFILGGNVKIIGRKGGGTKIVVKIPFKEVDKNNV